MKFRREILSILVAGLLACILLTAAGWLLLPENNVNSLKWGQYRAEDRNTIDVLYVGSSMSFCDISPAAVYKQCGVTGYSISGAELTIPISYYFIREACRTQTPKAVFLELGGMFFSRYEQFSADNIAFMPIGINHYEATLRVANIDDKLRLAFPVLSYHSLWSTCTGIELRERMFPGPSLDAGFVKLSHVNDDPSITYRDLHDSYYDESLTYLRRTAQFCREQGINLYLFLSPTLARTPVHLQDRLERDLESLEITEFIDFNAKDNWSLLKLDPCVDFADSIHMNVSGAKKLSENIAGRLIEMGYAPTENADPELWQRRVDMLDQG